MIQKSKASTRDFCPDGYRLAIQRPGGSEAEAMCYATRILGYRREDVRLVAGHIANVCYPNGQYQRKLVVRGYVRDGWMIFVKVGSAASS